MLKKSQKANRNATKSLSIALALANSVNTAAPLALPLAAIVPEMPKARQGNVDELLTTSFNRGGQLLDYLFFTTAYAETIGTGEATVHKDVSAGTADGDIINSGGTQDVDGTGIATNTTINTGGMQRVSSGGSASITTINGGTQMVLDGGTAASTTVNSSGRQDIYGGGSATGTTLNSGGIQYVYSEGNDLSATINNGGIQRVYGGTATGATVSGNTITSRGEQRVGNSGTAISTTIKTNGLQFVSSGGTAISATISGGVQTIAVGGSGSGTVVNGDQFVYGSATGTTLNSGRQTINQGGTATDTTIDGGEQHVSSGTASGTIINSGGEQHVSSGGSAVSTTINSGGEQLVYSSGTALGTMVSSGGLQNVLSGGTATGTIIYSSGAQYVNQGATASGGTISGALAHQMLYGNSYDDTVNSGGYQSVQDDGIATGTTVTADGFQEVYGTANGTNLNGGDQIIYADGTATGTVINSSGRQYVSAGGTATSAIVNEGGVQHVYQGATASGGTISGALAHQMLYGNSYDVTVNSGGYQSVQADGIATGTTVTADGFQEVYGNANGTILNGGAQYVHNGGNTSGTDINANGSQTVNSGGNASSTVINGGFQDVLDGGYATSTTIHDGTQTVSGGGQAFYTTINGGIQSVNSFGSATGTTVNSGGLQSVDSDATITDTTANADGVIAIEPGATIAGITTLNQGTFESITGGSLTINRLVTSGGIVRLSSLNANTHLTIQNLEGAADFKINTDLVNGQSDRITITRSTSEVSTIQVEYDPGFETGQTIKAAVSDPSSYLAVIFAEVEDQAKNDEANGETSFTALPTDYGAYRFTPVLDSAVIGDLGTRWIIKELSSGTSGGTGGDASETMLTASDVITNNLALWRSETHDLTKRMGELRRDSSQAGVWARVYRGKQETTNPRGRSTNTDYTAIQGGYDKKHDGKGNGTWHTGYTVGYLNADSAMTRGGGDASSLSFGLYGSWLGKNGHYLDIITKHGRLRNSYHNYLIDPSNTRVTGSYHNWGSSIAAEYGFRHERENGWYLEPQAQISLGRIGSASYTASDGTAVRNNHLNSVIGRLGLAIGRTTPGCSFYAKASVVREFNARSRVTMSTGDLAPLTLEQNLKDTWLEFALGLTGPLSKRTNGYLEISCTNGDTVKTPWLVNAGLRMNF